LAAGVRIFLQKILQSNIVEHGISKEPLQLGVLVFQALQALRLRNIHAPELRLPGIERRRADPVLAAKISRRNPRLLLAQNRHDLFLCKPRSLHRPVLPSIRTLASSGGLCGGHSSIIVSVLPKELKIDRRPDAGPLSHLTDEELTALVCAARNAVAQADAEAADSN
jgi:hypothetical protein